MAIMDHETAMKWVNIGKAMRASRPAASSAHDGVAAAGRPTPISPHGVIYAPAGKKMNRAARRAAKARKGG